jgi:hypothetical protein
MQEIETIRKVLQEQLDLRFDKDSTAYCKINEALTELNQLEKKLNRAREALSFYAVEANWEKILGSPTAYEAKQAIATINGKELQDDNT